MRNARLHELQAWINMGGKNINNLRYVDDTTLMAESTEDLKNLLMRVKEESGKANLKLNIKKTKIMASGPFYFLANRREKSGNSDRFPLLGL